MSYILEALKKSEKERQGDGVPGFQVDHSLPPVRRMAPRPPSWRVPGGIVLILLCAAALFWWLRPLEERGMAVESEVPGQDSEILPPLLETPKVAESDLVSPQGLGQVLAPVAAPVSGDISPQRQIPSPLQETPLAPRLPFIDDLPVAIQAALPELSFVGHVYSDVPEKRLIIINNRIVREGALIANGLSLVQIDQDGVVLRYNEISFRVKLF